MRKGIYRLEVYAPGHYLESAFTLESETPFQAIAEGDIFSSGSIEGFAEGSFTAPVVQVMHMMYAVDKESFAQHTSVFLGADCWNNLQDVLRQKIGR